MGGIIGKGTSLQMGEESSYGQGGTLTHELNFLSESLKYIPEKKSEDTLVAGITKPGYDIMGYRVEGDFSLLLKPRNIGLLLAMTFGVEASPTLKAETTGVYKHSFSPILPGISNSLLSFFMVVDRHVSVKKYTGLKAESMRLEAKSQDYLRGTWTVKGKQEDTGTKNTGLSIPDLKAFKFKGGTLKYDSGTAFGKVSGVTLNYSNKLDEPDYTLESGDYPDEPEYGEREITLELDCWYNSVTEAMRASNYIGNTPFDLALTFVSPSLIEPDEPYTLEILIPQFLFTEAHPNIQGEGKIRMNITGTALDNDGDPMEINLYDDLDTKYTL